MRPNDTRKWRAELCEAGDAISPEASQSSALQI
jgi:hypothetical protein